MQKTQEKYDLWNTKLKEIEFSEIGKIDAKVGEFWWYYEGMNIGNEISKDENFKRPCLILQNNLDNGLLFVVPLTTKFHSRMDQYCLDIRYYSIYGLKPCRVICNQMKSIDRKRLIGKISEKKIKRFFVNLVIDKIYSFIKKSPVTRTG